jgi:hypothetical protein
VARAPGGVISPLLCIREDVARVVADHPGIDASEASALYQFAGHMAAELVAADEDGGLLTTGQYAGPSLRNPEETQARLLQRYGPTACSAIRAAAAKEFNSLPEAVRDWIDAPNEHGDRLGNHIGVVVALALRQYARLSPEAARKEIDAIKAEPGYWRGDRLAIDKVRLLASIAARPSGRTQSAASPQPRALGTRGGDDVHVGPTHQTRDELRRELAALNQLGSDLHSSDGQRRKRAVARRQDIVKQLRGNP